MIRNACGYAGLLTLSLALIAFAPATLMAQSTPPAWTEFARLFDTSIDRDRIVGASVLLVQDGRVQAHHEHGLADREKARQVNEHTIFHYGSITKTLTAIAIMQLRDRRKLSLDDQVTRYIPELRLVHDPYGSMDNVTIRMLLSHSAGFQNPTWPYKQGKPWEPFEPTTWIHLLGADHRAVERQLVGNLCAKEQLRAPGTDAQLFWRYALLSGGRPFT